MKKEINVFRLFEAFAGYGSQYIAGKNSQKNFSSVGVSEVDKYAIVAYDSIHGDKSIIVDIPSYDEMYKWLTDRNIGMDYKTGRNTLKKNEVEPLYKACKRINNSGDISRIDPTTLPDMDMFTYSFPCQDISLAGKGKGLEKDSGTRSGLLWECKKIIEYKLPKYLLMENVKNLVGKKFKGDFDEWCKELELLGYENHWQVMNAKDYGIPQNRERVFMVSILGGGKFNFPDKEPLELRLKDMLEDEVDDKYYLKPEQYANLTQNIKDKELSNAVRCGGRGSVDRHSWDLVNANCNPSGKGMNGKIHTGDLAPTLTINKGEGPKVAIREATKKGYAIAEKGDSINFEQPNSKTRRGRVGKGVAQTLTTSCNQGTIQQIGNIVKTGNFPNPQRGRIYSASGVSPSLNTCGGGGLEPKVIVGSVQKNAAINREGVCPTLTTAMGEGGGHVPMHNYDHSIRKLTPLECFRLMGVSDEDFYTIRETLNNLFHKGVDRSSSQLYKLAGNSIVTDKLEKIYNNIEESESENKWVVIDNVEHCIIDGHIACNPLLSNKAYNTTEKHSVCPECAKITQRVGKIVQLSLF